MSHKIIQHVCIFDILLISSVPLPPAVTLVRLDSSTLQFRLLSQPKFPVEHVSVKFTSIVVVLSAKDTHEVLYNITYPVSTLYLRVIPEFSLSLCLLLYIYWEVLQRSWEIRLLCSIALC